MQSREFYFTFSFEPGQIPNNGAAQPRSRLMRINVDARNPECVFTVNQRSRSASVLHIAFEDATLTLCDFYRIFIHSAYTMHMLQSKFRILKIGESITRALFLYNCTPNISRSADASVSIA